MDPPSSVGSPTISARLRQRVHAGETLFGAWAVLGSPLAAELLGRAGFDWVVIDLEHGTATESELLAHLAIVEGTGAAALVRPQSAERLPIGRALDLGARGVVIPRIEHTEDARDAVFYMRYPPHGVRGLALLTRGAGLGAVAHRDIATLNEQVVGVVQIESAGVLEAARDIAGIDGVDVLFVGPTDLSHSLGIPGQFAHPTYQGALRTVVDAARSSGKAAGILLYDPDAFGPHLELGFSFVGLGADASFVAGGAAAALRAARARRA